MPKASAVSVLIVDDQQSMRGICKYILNQLGFTNIIEAKNRELTLARIRRMLPEPLQPRQYLLQ